MHSELYHGLLDEGRLYNAAEKDKYFWVDGMEWLSPEESAKRMNLLKEYWAGIDKVFSEALDGYTLFAINAGGDPWLVDEKSGRTSLLSYDSGSSYPKHEYNSVEAAVFVRLLRYAAESIDDIGVTEEELRSYLKNSADVCEKYFPTEWTAELRRIADGTLENGSLLSDEKMKQIREDLCI